VDTCTVAAPDAITAFAVPNPNCSLQSSRFFRVWWLDELPRRPDHPAYFGLANITWANLFSRRHLLPSHQRHEESMPVSGAFPKKGK
jgi:hypothetical protein